LEDFLHDMARAVPWRKAKSILLWSGLSCPIRGHRAMPKWAKLHFYRSFAEKFCKARLIPHGLRIDFRFV
jgi:hypothetical protein